MILYETAYKVVQFDKNINLQCITKLTSNTNLDQYLEN